jgi:hypothetical protein
VRLQGDDPPPPWPYQWLVETACQLVRRHCDADFAVQLRAVKLDVDGFVVVETPQSLQSVPPHRA